MEEMLAYNSHVFLDEKVEPWPRFEENPPPADPAPRFPLARPQGELAHLVEVWRKAVCTVIDFGSLT